MGTAKFCVHGGPSEEREFDWFALTRSRQGQASRGSRNREHTRRAGAREAVRWRDEGEGAHTVRSATDSACSWDHPLYWALTSETKASGKKFGEKGTNFFDGSHFNEEGGGP
jgi:hypothetical protein